MPHGPISCRALDDAAASQLEDGGEAAALRPREALLPKDGGDPETKEFQDTECPVFTGITVEMMAEF